MGTAHIGPNAFIRDRKTGMTYSCDCDYHEFTDVLLRNLRDRFTDINFIGIRVLESRDAGGFIRRYCGFYGETYDKTMSAWKKRKGIYYQVFWLSFLLWFVCECPLSRC